MAFESHEITLSDGRRLQVAECGDRAGATVVFHHGTPGSAALARLWDQSAVRHHLRIISSSRAGYATSSRLADRSVLDVVSDTREVLDHFRASSYVAVGWSGGGPHALACAARDSERCVGVLSLAGAAPRSDEFDWTAGMGPENIEEFALALEGGPRYEEHIRSFSEAGRTATESNIVEFFGGLLSEPDKKVLQDSTLRGVLADATAQSGSVGHFGFLDDDQALLKSWGFDLTEVRGPCEIWFGDYDLMVPPTHGAFLVSSIPNAVAQHVPFEGHCSIVMNNVDEILASAAFMLAR